MARIQCYFFLFLCFFYFGCENNNVKTRQYDSSLEESAVYAYEAQNYEKAVYYFNQLIKDDSSIGRYYYMRASSYGILGQAEKGANDYLASARFGYMKSASYFNAGLLNTYVKDSLALIYFEQSLEQFDGSEPGLTKDMIQKKYEECSTRLKNEIK